MIQYSIIEYSIFSLKPLVCGVSMNQKLCQVELHSQPTSTIISIQFNPVPSIKTDYYYHCKGRTVNMVSSFCCYVFFFWQTLDVDKSGKGILQSAFGHLTNIQLLLWPTRQECVGADNKQQARILDDCVHPHHILPNTSSTTKIRW